MADLYNLLDEIDEPQEQPFQSQEDSVASDIEQDREQVELPTFEKPSTAASETDERVDLEDLVAAQSLTDLPYTRLQHLWSQELHSPELLAFDATTVQDLTEAVERQEEDAENMEFGSDNNMNALVQSILKIDADRVKFLLADLLRTRLGKIEEHPLHMRTRTENMSENEVDFLKDYGALMESHLNRTVLDHFPQDVWKKLDAPEMIDEPDLDTYVFCKVKDDVAIDNGTVDRPNLQQHSEGTCLIVRYNKIRELLLEERVELLM